MLYDVKWQTKEDLRLAADILDQVGWCQRVAIDTHLRVCLVGAINLAIPATHDMTRFNNACEAVRQHIGRVDIVDWNDEPGRTKEQVTTALRNA